MEKVEYKKLRYITSLDLECKKSDLKYFIIDNKGNKDSVFHLKLVGNIGVGSISSGWGYVYKWLCNQNFNGSFGLDLRDTYGLSFIRGEDFTSETPEYPLYSVRIKYLYLPEETKGIYWHSFINQSYFSKISYSLEDFSFFEKSLSETSIDSFVFPQQFSLHQDSLPWRNLKEIEFPNTFAISRLLSKNIVRNSKFNQWEFLLNKCTSLNKIRIPKGMDGFLLSIQKNYINWITEKFPNIYIEYLDNENS